MSSIAPCPDCGAHLTEGHWPDRCPAPRAYELLPLHLMGFDLSMLEVCAACGVLVFAKERRFWDVLNGAAHTHYRTPTLSAERKARSALAQMKRDDQILSALGAALRAPGLLEFDRKAIRWAIREMPEPPDMTRLRTGTVPIPMRIRGI